TPPPPPPPAPPAPPARSTPWPHASLSGTSTPADSSIHAASDHLTSTGGSPTMADHTHVRVNRARWNQTADDYQTRNAPQIRQQAFTGEIEWGLWAIPESQLNVLGEVHGEDVLEVGCGWRPRATAPHSPAA